jgi:pyrroline-5-carboxylate reductase
MKLAKIAFLGSGKLGQALLLGLQKSRPPCRIAASVRSPESLARLKERFPWVEATTDNSVLLEKADLVVLGVKPHAALGLLASLKDTLPPNATLASLCARLPIARLREILADRPDLHLVRLMPNTASENGHGLLGVCTEDGRALPEELEAFFSRLGRTHLIPENDMDAFTVLGACTPAFFLKMSDALAEAARRAGLDAAFVQSSLAQVLIGAGKLLENDAISADERVRQIATPGGVTASGLAALDAARLKEASFAAFETALEKCRSLQL